MVVIFGEFLMFYQILLLLQVKQRLFFFYIIICTRFYLFNKFATIIKLKEITLKIPQKHVLAFPFLKNKAS